MGKYLAQGHGVWTERSEANAYGPHTGLNFINGFAKKALAEPYGSYDNIPYFQANYQKAFSEN